MTNKHWREIGHPFASCALDLNAPFEEIATRLGEIAQCFKEGRFQALKM
jgi:hypothetical protein